MGEPLAGVAAGIVPARAEFTAAADIGLHRGAAALQPQLAQRRMVGRAHRKAEAAIGGDMDRRIAALVGRPGLHIGNPFAIDRDRFVRGHREAVGGKCPGRLLEQRRAADAFDQHQGGRRQGILDIGEQVAIAFALVAIKTPDIDDTDRRNSRQSVAAPSVRGRGADLERWPQFVKDRQHELAGSPEKPLQGAPWPRLENDGEIAVARKKRR